MAGIIVVSGTNGYLGQIPQALQPGLRFASLHCPRLGYEHVQEIASD
jgi:hypothetical protein